MAYGVNAPFGLRPVASINGGSWTEKTNQYYIYASDDGATTYTSSIFTGDPVVFNTKSTTGSAQFGTISVYSPNFTDGTPSTFSTTPILGVFQGCEYTDTTGKLVQSAYWPGATKVLKGTQIKAFVIDDPNVVFDVQVSVNRNAVDENGWDANPYFPVNPGVASKAGAFGSNFALNIGGGTNFTERGYANNPQEGNTRTGQSVFYLCVSTEKSDNADPDYIKTTTTLPLKAISYTLNPQNIAAPGLTMETTPFLNVLVMINNHCYKAGTAGTALV